jgi:hypothetical protein
MSRSRKSAPAARRSNGRRRRPSEGAGSAIVQAARRPHRVDRALLGRRLHTAISRRICGWRMLRGSSYTLREGHCRFSVQELKIPTHGVRASHPLNEPSPPAGRSGSWSGRGQQQRHAVGGAAWRDRQLPSSEPRRAVSTRSAALRVGLTRAPAIWCVVLHTDAHASYLPESWSAPGPCPRIKPSRGRR